MAAVTPETWARIWVKAWQDSEFKKRLEENPVEAVSDPEVQKEFGFTYDKNKDKLFDLDDIDYDGENFRDMADLDLAEIALNEKLNGNPFMLMKGSSWAVGPKPET